MKNRMSLKSRTALPFVTALAVCVIMMALLTAGAAHAGCCQIKFSDPDLRVGELPKCPTEFAAVDGCVIEAEFTDITAITLQCPQNKGQDDPGCEVNGHERIEIIGEQGEPEDCTGRGCKFNVRDVFTLQDLADNIDEEEPPFGLNIVQFTDEQDNVCPAVVPTSAVVELTGFAADENGNAVGDPYFRAKVSFPVLFSGLDDLCLKGNFQGQILSLETFAPGVCPGPMGVTGVCT